MIEAERVALILLAAGRSLRFGTRDKLATPWRGKRLAQHAAEALATIPFAAHIAITRDESSISLPDVFKAIRNPLPERGLSSSIELGIEALQTQDIDACLIALADMPLVPQAHFLRLLEAFEEDGADLVATAKAGRAQVPALFARRHFEQLRSLSGDKGAAALLGQAKWVACDPALLADFDRPADFEE